MSEKSITGAELARFLGITKQAVSNWFAGKAGPERDTIVKLADFFNVTTDYLLGRVDNPMEIIATSEDFTRENLGGTVSTFALSRADNPDADLPEEAQKQIEEFRAYIRQKYKKPE